MKSMKNVILLVVCFIFLSGCNQVNEDEVQKYIKEKHGIDVVVTHMSPLNENNMGHVYHTVQVKNNKNIQFRVEVDGLFYSSIKSDEYKYGKKTYEAYQKFQPTLEEIKKLGYVETKTDNTLQYLSEDRRSDEGKPTNELLLTLQMSNEIDFSQFESVELDRLYTLFQLIQKNNKKITELEIKDYNGKSLGGPFKNVQKMITKEELLLTMKKTMNNTIDIYLENRIKNHTKIEERLIAIQNNRFELQGITYANLEYMDVRGYKVNLIINTGSNEFENNPLVIKDLIKVTTILKEELYNKKFQIYLQTKNGTRYTPWLSSEEIKKAINIEELVKERYPKN
ncbi:hypothetical protein [Bacillus thuringiensis]|uniref:hypothetical protein n=1 Tax=Bacillus thuringiensis TaxID=1428 RepID=UPI000BF605FF|nr:hypothetical protein [Bacillus thuringiensis]PFS47251.1 hypothetical protein COK87_28905 [Bacillus thuringiensis]